MRVDYSKDYSNEYIVENGRYYGTYYFQNVVYEGNWTILAKVWKQAF